MHNYSIWILDQSGDPVVVFDDWNSLTIEHILNGISTHTLSFAGWDARQYFDLDYIVQVRRRVHESDWMTEYEGFHRTPQRKLETNGAKSFISYGRGFNDLLHRRFIQYFAGTAYTDKTGPADDVMKELVRENLGSLGASSPDRFRNVVTPIDVAADVSAGPSWTGAVAHKNLLSVLQEIQKFGRVDFQVVRTSAAEFEFRTYYPQLGLDRREGTIYQQVFSPELGNMVDSSYTQSRTEEAQAITVLGQGEGEDRVVVTQTGTGDNDSPWNDIEYVHDYRQEDLASGLVAAGQQKLFELRPKDSFVFQILQTEESVYGVDYAVGDIVTARMDNVVQTVRIVGATISVADGRETVKLKFEDVVE